jgi:hypothetical protein
LLNLKMILNAGQGQTSTRVASNYAVYDPDEVVPP